MTNKMYHNNATYHLMILDFLKKNYPELYEMATIYNTRERETGPPKLLVSYSLREIICYEPNINSSYKRIYETITSMSKEIIESKIAVYKLKNLL